MIHEHVTTFDGKAVQDFAGPGSIGDLAGTAPRVRCEYDGEHTVAQYLGQLLEEPGATAMEALVIGLWLENGEAYQVSPQPAIDLLVARRAGLPALRALFIGDIISEENEMSWIRQGDMSSIWAAFPKLQTFYARGGEGLRLGAIDHAMLRELVVQTGGMPATLLREALAATAPLEHLELWLGTADYGADSSVGDFRDLLEGRLFPKLRYLGLRNSEYSDDLAEALARSAILDRIDTLDLSLGTLTDRGARALIQSGKLGRLSKLDVTYHYMSPDGQAELAAATPNLAAGDRQVPDNYDGTDYYYVAVSE